MKRIIFAFLALLALLLPAQLFAESIASVGMGNLTCEAASNLCKYDYLTTSDMLNPSTKHCGDTAGSCTVDGDCSPEVCEPDGCSKEIVEGVNGIVERLTCPYIQTTTSAGETCWTMETRLGSNYTAENQDLQLLAQVSSAGRVCLKIHVQSMSGETLFDWDGEYIAQVDTENLNLLVNDSTVFNVDGFPVSGNTGPIDPQCEVKDCRNKPVFATVCRRMDKTGSTCSIGAPGQSTGSLYIYGARIQKTY